MSRCGIYKITCKNNKRVYFGQSKDFNKRKYDHKRSLRLNKHENRHLQRAYNKYGKGCFIFEFIEEVVEDRLDEVEQGYINSMPWRQLFNMNKVASKPPSPKGRKMTEEQKKVHSERLKGDKNGMYGRKHTEEAKRKMSEYRKGRSLNLSQEQLKAKSELRKQFRYTEESKLKMSKAKRSWTDEKAEELYNDWNSIEDYRGKMKLFEEKYNRHRHVLKKMLKSYENEILKNKL